MGEWSVTTVDSGGDDERVVRLTEREALANVRAVLELRATGKLRCSDKISRPTVSPDQELRFRKALLTRGYVVLGGAMT